MVNNSLHHNRRLFIAFQKTNQHFSKHVHYISQNNTKDARRLMNSYLTGFTSTSMGSKESFLPHLGHFPSYCWRTSSGGFRSGPSYNTWLHPLQITRCGTAFSLSEITKVTSTTYLLVTSAQQKQTTCFAAVFLSRSSLTFLNHGDSNSAGYDGC